MTPGPLDLTHPLPPDSGHPWHPGVGVQVMGASDSVTHWVKASGVQHGRQFTQWIIKTQRVRATQRAKNGPVGQ